MKTLLFRGVAVFFILMVATSIMMDVFKTEFGVLDFFNVHGYFFLFFITLFPRLTLLFSSVASGGFLWWVAFFVCPRILVATLATMAYFHTNPVLVTISWVIALGGEILEKWGISGRNKFIIRSYRGGGGFTSPKSNPEETQTVINRNDAIEAEFTKK